MGYTQNISHHYISGFYKDCDQCWVRRCSKTTQKNSISDYSEFLRVLPGVVVAFGCSEKETDGFASSGSFVLVTIDSFQAWDQVVRHLKIWSSENKKMNGSVQAGSKWLFRRCSESDEICHADSCCTHSQISEPFKIHHGRDYSRLVPFAVSNLVAQSGLGTGRHNFWLSKQKNMEKRAWKSLSLPRGHYGQPPPPPPATPLSLFLRLETGFMWDFDPWKINTVCVCVCVFNAVHINGGGWGVWGGGWGREGGEWGGLSYTCLKPLSPLVEKANTGTFFHTERDKFHRILSNLKNRDEIGTWTQLARSRSIMVSYVQLFLGFCWCRTVINFQLTVCNTLLRCRLLIRWRTDYKMQEAAPTVAL